MCAWRFILGAPVITLVAFYGHNFFFLFGTLHNTKLIRPGVRFFYYDNRLMYVVKYESTALFYDALYLRTSKDEEKKIVFRRKSFK